MTIADVTSHDRERPPSERICASRGLTFAGLDPVAASPESADADWWWFGLDCQHVFDETARPSPGGLKVPAPKSRSDVYRTSCDLDAEVEELATRLRAVEARRAR
jgi:hypothetical protein